MTIDLTTDLAGASVATSTTPDQAPFPSAQLLDLIKTDAAEADAASEPRRSDVRSA